MASSLDIIKTILDEEMQMPKGRVWAYNANVDLPKDDKLFIVLSYGERKPISNNIKYVLTPDGMNEVQTMNVCEDVIISLLSKNTEARDRAHEPHLALGSTFSRNLQFKEHIHISLLGEVWDASFLEATSRINRFDVKCRVFKSYDKIKSVDYYDKYQFESWTELQGGEVIKEEITQGENNGRISNTD